MTVNAEPSADRSEGCATGLPDGVTSWIAPAVHSGSMIAPVWPPAVAEPVANATVPKFASGLMVHPFGLNGLHIDGASAIHSADVRSGSAIVVCVTALSPVVRSWSWSVIAGPSALTSAEIASPGDIRRSSLIAGAGTSSCHAEWIAAPPPMQSADVPTCSSAFQPSEKPPRPTQKAELPGPDVEQSRVGSTQLPLTSTNDTPAAVTLYPAQLVLCESPPRRARRLISVAAGDVAAVAAA